MRPLRTIGVLLGFLVFLGALYVGGYYANAECVPEGLSRCWVEYRIGGDWAKRFFGPMREIDQTIRPEWCRWIVSKK